MTHARRHSTTIAASACLLTVAGTRATVISASNATDLLGGIVSVSFAVQTSPSSFFVFTEGATILAGAQPGEVVAGVSGSHKFEGQTYGWAFEFSLIGPTETSPWTLLHSGGDNRVYIMDVILSTDPTPLAGAVFDDGSTPSTSGSGPGSPSAITVSGPAVINTNYDPGYLWASPRNAGDLYTNVIVQWAELNNHTIFGIGTTARWLLDTDAIPAPAPLAAIGLVAVSASRGRRRG